MPSLTVALFDARVGILAARRPDMGRTVKEITGVFSVDFLPEILEQREGALRHNGGANYGFVDGHIKWLQPNAITSSQHSDGVKPGFGL